MYNTLKINNEISSSYCNSIPHMIFSHRLALVLVCLWLIPIKLITIVRAYKGVIVRRTVVFCVAAI